MKKIVITLVAALVLTGCNAQQKKEDANTKNVAKDHSDSSITPKGTWKVNKEVDENGNLIRYDSIYSYSYGNINGQEINPAQMDSAMASFKKYMQLRMPQFSSDVFDPIKSDSIGKQFFEQGFFENHWEDFFPDIQKQLKQMDSLHQQFFQSTRPGLFPPEDKMKKS